VPTVAQAQRQGEPATALSFTAPDGTPIELVIQDGAARSLCRDLTIGDTVISDGDACDVPARVTADELVPAVARTNGLTVITGTVRDGTRSVDVALPGNVRKRVRTVEAKNYTGRYAGKLRFWGLAVKGDIVIGSLTLRDETGAPFAAVDIDRAGLPRAGKARRLDAIKDFEGGPNALFALAPKILVDEDRSPTKRRPALCAAIKANPGPLATNACAVRKKRLEVVYTRGCQEPHILSFGVGPTSIAAAVADYGAAGTSRMSVYRVPKSVGRPGVVLFDAKDGRAKLRRVIVFNADGDQTGVAKIQQAACSPGQDEVAGGIG
jgi:hypothetical protein